MCRKSMILLASAAALVTPVETAAQTAAPTSPAGQASPVEPVNSAQATSVEDIVVTATRRSTDLQRVAATVTAIPATALKAFKIDGVLQLPTLTSGLVVSPGGGNSIFLRGVGSSSTGFNEAQTAVYIDGVYLANPAVGIYSFNNVERIEVLKGPQGTLYGRNATAGLIAVTTHDPGQELRVDASAGYANYDTLTANFYGSAPLTGNLAANVAVFYQKQSRGWGRNVFTGHDNQKGNETGVESKLVWRPTSSTKVTESFIYDYNNRDYGYAYGVAPGTIGPDGTLPLGNHLNTSRIDPSAPIQIYIGSFKIEQDLGFAALTSLTAYQNSHQVVTNQSGGAFLGQPYAGQGGVYNRLDEHNRTWTQEFQLISRRSPSRLDWVAGAFYYNDHTEISVDSFNTCVGAVCAPSFTPTRNLGRPTTLSYSAYGDVTYRFFQATRLTVGLRYTDETKGLSGSVTPLAGYPNSVAVIPGSVAPPGQLVPSTGVTYPGQPFTFVVNGVKTPQPAIPTRLHFNKLTYRVVLAQDFGDNVHAYISDNFGFKSGAFNANSFINPPARPETLHSYEAGIKSELFDRRARLNLSYFHYDYNDVQVRSLAPPAPPGNALLQNAAKERLNGVDADLSIVPFRGFTINGTFEYLDARYADYPGTTCTTPGTKIVKGGTVGPANDVTVGTATAVTCNLAGYSLVNAAPVSATLGFVYNVDTSQGSFTLSANDRYNARYPLVADHTLYNEAHHLIDASLAWTAPNKRVDAQIFVRNLTNENTYVLGQVSTSYLVTSGPPRTFGATVGFHY